MENFIKIIQIVSFPVIITTTVILLRYAYMLPSYTKFEKIAEIRYKQKSILISLMLALFILFLFLGYFEITIKHSFNNEFNFEKWFPLSPIPAFIFAVLNKMMKGQISYFLFIGIIVIVFIYIIIRKIKKFENKENIIVGCLNFLCILVLSIFFIVDYTPSDILINILINISIGVNIGSILLIINNIKYIFEHSNSNFKPNNFFKSTEFLFLLISALVGKFSGYLFFSNGKNVLDIIAPVIISFSLFMLIILFFSYIFNQSQEVLIGILEKDTIKEISGSIYFESNNDIYFETIELDSKTYKNEKYLYRYKKSDIKYIKVKLEESSLKESLKE